MSPTWLRYRARISLMFNHPPDHSPPLVFVHVNFKGPADLKLSFFFRKYI